MLLSFLLFLILSCARGQESDDIGRMSSDTGVMTVLEVILTVLLIASAALIYRMRKRIQHYRRELDSRNIIDRNHSQVENGEPSDAHEQDRPADMHSNSQILSSPQLITGKDEGKFRRAFNQTYPDFIKNLKNDFPALSANDELVCMLIYLHHTSEEISDCLGISRASVNSARYRLRTKFQLPKSLDLDSFLSSR